MENRISNTRLVACEIFSRVTGYYRPVHQYNRGKKEEFHLRKYFAVPHFKEAEINEKIIE